MKRLTFCLAAVGFVTTGVHAQSTIQFSGFLASAVRYSTNTNSAGDNRLSLGALPDSYGVLRLRGTEDLGGGMQAHFRLESAIETDTGANPSRGTGTGLFGRESTVGLTTPFGSIDFGRVNVIGNASEPLVRADPLGLGAPYTELVWLGAYTGVRSDNTLRYRISTNGVTASALYSLGEQAGNSAKARIVATTLGYASGPATAGISYQVASDLTEKKVKTFTAGIGYKLAAAILHGAFLHSDADGGFSGAGSFPRTGLANFSSDQTMNAFLAGLTYHMTPALTLKMAYIQGKTDKGTFINVARGGMIKTAYLVGDYALSKRTSIVAGVDYNKWSGGFAGYWGSSVESQTGTTTNNGRDTRLNLSFGMRHRF